LNGNRAELEAARRHNLALLGVVFVSLQGGRSR
jgi:hypothetical protein